MAKGPAPVDEERLPWLEPYRDAIATKQKVARRSHGGLVAVAAALGVLFAAGGGYWLGQRGGDSPRPQPTRMANAPVTVAPVSHTPVASTPVGPALPVAPVPAAAAPPTAEPPSRAVTVPAPAPRKVAVATSKSPVRRAVRQRKIRSAGIESARIREVRAAQERATPTPAPLTRPVVRTVTRPWPKMPSPGPAGQVVQLGAFRTEGGALAAYRSRLARYPVLGSMPRVVVPVVTKPRGRVLYVLRLGTASRQQSAIVCRNLRISGDHCIVIG